MTAWEISRPAVARFPDDQTPLPAVVMVYTVRFDQALVAKHLGPRRKDRWGKRRWIPKANVVRRATDREATVGVVIEPLPPREAP